MEQNLRVPLYFRKSMQESWGTIVGHLLALREDALRKLDELVRCGGLSPEEIAEFEEKHRKHLSDEGFHQDVQPHLTKYFCARPAAWLKFSEAMVAARRKTFDKLGGLKETTASKVYSKILENWPEIEEMSSPTELCEF